MKDSTAAAFRLPEGFLMGSATAATQIEGGDENNNWYDWYRKGHITDGTSCTRANDHWNRYAEDIDIMGRMNHKVYRMGLEWSRIEPRNGNFDESAIKHYRDELLLLRSKGIKPLVTLHHFSHPIWFVDEGGFEKEASVKYFERYVKYAVENLGDLAEEYITINEPNVYMANGYVFGTWPPGKKDMGLGFKVFKNMTRCHVAAYGIIHETRERLGFEGKTMVGVANHLRVFDPAKSWNPLDFIASKVMQYLFQDVIMRSMTSGFMRPPIGFGHVKEGARVRGNDQSIGSGEGKRTGRKPNRRYCDFLGINYYTRSIVFFKGFRDDSMPGTLRNDLGWEIYPEGLSRLCRKYYKKYRSPIWITENGTCDKADAFRAKYIYDHLREISKVCDEGIPVERYYHWTLMDNFEWVEGESAPFGLIAVDFETQVRTIRKSGEFFSRICAENEVTNGMIEEFLTYE